MNLIKKLLVSAMLIGTTVGAHANDYYLGNLSAGYNSIGSNSVSGTFQDNIHFTLGASSVGSFGVGALNFTVGGMPMLNINNLTMSLIDNSSNNLGSGLDFTAYPLNAGNYALQVTGNATGVFGGLYAGGIQISAVPEPGVWSFLMVGLAMLGFVAYRRRTMY